MPAIIDKIINVSKVSGKNQMCQIPNFYPELIKKNTHESVMHHNIMVFCVSRRTTLNLFFCL